MVAREGGFFCALTTTRDCCDWHENQRSWIDVAKRRWRSNPVIPTTLWSPEKVAFFVPLQQSVTAVTGMSSEGGQQDHEVDYLKRKNPYVTKDEVKERIKKIRTKP